MRRDIARIVDDLWAEIAPLLPPQAPHPKGGRLFVDDRAALCAILFVLWTGVPWRAVPRSPGSQPHHCLALVARLAGGGRVGRDASCTAGPGGQRGCNWVGSGMRGQRQHPGQKGGSGLGPNPTDRAKTRVKIHLVTDARGLPLTVRCEPANRRDSVWFKAVIDAILAIRTPSGQRRKRPGKVHPDKGHDIPRCHRALRDQRIGDSIAQAGVASSDRPGRRQWVVGQRLAPLKRMRRLAILYERRSDIFQALVTLTTCCVIYCRRLTQLHGL